MADQSSGMPPISQLDFSDPAGMIQNMQLQRRMAIANALMQQGLTPMEGTQMAGQVAVKQSPLQGIAKIAQALGGVEAGNSAIQQMGQLQAQRIAAWNAANGGQQQSPQVTNNAPNGGTPAGQTAMASPDASPVVQSIQQQPQPNAPQPAQQFNPASMTGMSNMQLQYLKFTDPKAYADLMSKINLGMTTESTKTALAGGTDAGAANRAAQYKANVYQPEPGKPITVGGAYQGAYPTLPAGGSFGAPGPNGMPQGVVPTPGYNDVNSGTVGSQTHATQANTIGNVTDAEGRSVPAWMGAAANVGTAQLLGKPVGPPATTGTVQAPAARPTIGQSSADQATQPQAAKTLLEAQTNLPGMLNTRNQLESALNIIQSGQFSSGPASQQKVNLLGVLQNAGINVDQGDVTGTQTLSKLLGNAVNSSAGASGAMGSDSRLDSFKHGNPNVDLQNPAALERAVRLVLSQTDAAIAGTQYMSGVAKTSGAANAVTQWNGAMQPKVFEFARMSPAEQVEFVRSGGDTPAFENAYNAAKQNGWILQTR